MTAAPNSPVQGAAGVPRAGVDAGGAGDSVSPRRHLTYIPGGPMHEQHTYTDGSVVVQARKVTSNTIAQVAEFFGLETWGAGVLVSTSWGTDHAGVGDWVVRTRSGWLILSDRDFTRTYRRGGAS